MSTPETPTVAPLARSRFRIDAAILIALTPVLAAAVRIWLYSGGDTSLFLVLVRTLNVPAVLIGTGALIVPVGTIILTITLATDATFRRNARLWVSSNRTILTVAIPILLVLVGYTAPWPLLVEVGVICALAIGYYYFRKAWKTSKPDADTKTHPGPDSAATAITLITLFLLTPANMWLPMERIQINNEKAQTGYVLQSDGSWTTILTSERDVNLVRTPRIESRKICSSDGAGTLALSIQNGGLQNGVNC